MDIKNVKDKKVIILQAKPNNTYSILSFVFFGVLLLICIGTILYFGDSPVKAFSILFVPLALLIFLLKVVIWNIFGTETIVLHKNSIESTFDYQYIYKLTHKHIPFEKYQLKLRANTSTEMLAMSEGLEKEYADAKFKLHFKFSNDTNYQSSISINQKELQEISELIRS